MALVEDCAPGYLVNFYIDNIVDKQIELAPQMQPHVITRPRENFIQASSEKPLKRNENEKVTARRKLALEPCAGDVEDTGNKDVVEKLPPPPPLSEYLKFKKAGWREDSEDTCIDVADKLPPPSPLPKFLKRNVEKVKKTRCRGDADKMLPPPPPLCEYEKLKLDKMRANNEVYKSLGLPHIVSTFKDAVESSSKSKGKKGKETTIEEDDSQYVPANEGDVESDDSSDYIESVKQKKIDVEPRTHSRANAAPGKSGTATERAAIRAYCPQPVKPTSTKIFRQSSNDGPAPGTVATYFALRDRQMNNDEAPMNENVVEFKMEQNADEEVHKVRAPRKRRGPTKMIRVHGRNPNEKVVISLNAKGQAISNIEGDVVQLSNFLGTLARDNVSLAYVNWHVVPDQLKQKLWEYTLGKYVIPDEGRKWVYTTLSNAWKIHKARVKKAHYTKYNTDEDRLDNRPNRVPLEDFKMLLKYWGDEAKLARENAEHRKSLVETHSLGHKPVTLVVEKLKKADPNLEHPSDAQIYSITRKREERREYKSNTEQMKEFLAKIQKLMEEGKEAEANAVASDGKAHAPNWLLGRTVIKRKMVLQSLKALKAQLLSDFVLWAVYVGCPIGLFMLDARYGCFCWMPDKAVLLDATYGRSNATLSIVANSPEKEGEESSKGKSVALKVNAKSSKERYVEVARKKNNLPESDTNDSSSNPDDDTDFETDENMKDSNVMQMAALLVKGFKRMQFKKSQKNRSFRKKFTRGERKSTRRRDGKYSNAGKVDRSKIKCYNCDEAGHFATECKKTKHDKGKNKALITSSKNWMDSSDFENEDT
ncbi:hypothetical protein AgCh_004851 [Apium graveolens]